MSLEDWNLEASEEAGQQAELQRQKAILSDEDWEAWERLQEERAEEEYHEKRYGERHCPNCRYDTRTGDCCSHPANDGTGAFWERMDESECFAPKGAV